MSPHVRVGGYTTQHMGGGTSPHAIVGVIYHPTSGRGYITARKSRGLHHPTAEWGYITARKSRGPHHPTLNPGGGTSPHVRRPAPICWQARRDVPGVSHRDERGGLALASATEPAAKALHRHLLQLIRKRRRAVRQQQPLPGWGRRCDRRPVRPGHRLHRLRAAGLRASIATAAGATTVAAVAAVAAATSDPAAHAVF